MPRLLPISPSPRLPIPDSRFPIPDSRFPKHSVKNCKNYLTVHKI
ncbi:hypothetical protein BJP36_43705 [Moorena producens JHB]|uniref:Uncharacterized protein n=1 Tax=Moorena producens (strain JHB) TaxID=1454205 RepID=A0A9Q9STA7_MOOP1|nr:hypothetical protein [Moorena producens]WAN69269.1 hypothetical protein BJP36_43705 [Moorena producens JHB]